MFNFYFVIMMKMCTIVYILVIILTWSGHFDYVHYVVIICVIILSLFCHYIVSIMSPFIIFNVLSLYCHHDVIFCFFYLLVIIRPIYCQLPLVCHQIVIILSSWCFLYCVHILVIIMLLYDHGHYVVINLSVNCHYFVIILSLLIMCC